MKVPRRDRATRDRDVPIHRVRRSDDGHAVSQRYNAFSISAWITFAAGSSSDQEILAKEDDNATGYAVAAFLFSAIDCPIA